MPITITWVIGPIGVLGQMYRGELGDLVQLIIPELLETNVGQLPLNIVIIVRPRKEKTYIRFQYRQLFSEYIVVLHFLI